MKTYCQMGDSQTWYNIDEYFFNYILSFSIPLPSVIKFSSNFSKCMFLSRQTLKPPNGLKKLHLNTFVCFVEAGNETRTVCILKDVSLLSRG